jgi:GntR family transcriptional regulator, arabinose operon transcriptional repressor
MARAYHEVAAELRKRIESGHYGPKMPLPSERALEEEFDIHRATVRRALSLLVSEGLIVRNPGQRAYANLNHPPRGGSIGLFAAEPSNRFARSLIANGISEVLEERHSSLRLMWSNYRPFQLNLPHREEDVFPADKLSGLVLWPPYIVAVDRLIAARRLMPVTLVDVRVPGFESDFVGFKDMDAGYEAAKHLYEMGHRRMAFIGDIVPETVQYRRFGFLRFCQDAGIEPDWEFGAFGGSVLSKPEALQRSLPLSLKKALTGLPRAEWPTAALCANDETAADMMAYLSQKGLRVPQDLALVGFGGDQPGLLNALGLTTMEQPYEQVGHAAANMILSRIESHHHDRNFQEVRLPMKLIVRSSCGHVPTPAR